MMKKPVNRHIKLYYKSAAALFLSLLLLFSAVPLLSFAAGESGVTTVRLGYFDFQSYMLGAEEGAAKSGYVYDLLCDIAAINNWQYEYVYGDFNDLYVQLMADEIDILPCLVYTDERAEKHLFSDEEIYAEEYLISVLNEKAGAVTDVHDLDGKRLSTVIDTHQNEAFAQWAEENGISMELVYTASYEDSWQQLRDGRADYILNIDSAAQDSGFTSVFEVGAGSSRFAIAPGREDIRRQMNAAIDTIYEINPFSVAHLKEKYLSDTLSSYKLSEAEHAWLAEHEVIRIAGFRDNLPYTYEDSAGNVTGVYPDILSDMFQKLGISTPVEWVLYANETEMDKALSVGEADLVCPFYYGHYYAQTNSMIISEKIHSASMGLLYGEKTKETDIRTIAVADSNLVQYFVKENYPAAQLLPCSSVEKCIYLVSSGKADAAVAHITLLQEYSGKYLKSFQLKTLVSGCPVCFAASPEDGMLICILNRGLHLISDSDLQDLEMRHTPEKDYSLWSFIRNNKLLTAAILLALLAIILFAAERAAASKSLKKSLDEITRQKEIIEANEQQLVEAEEAANAANKAKSTFLFNMSHDIRTPMNAILGYSDRMLKHLDEKDVVSDSARKIRASGDYLLSLINDVLDMARIESDKVKLDPDVYDLKERDFALCSVFEVDMQKKNLTFNSDLSGIKDSVLVYDGLKLRQILLNLISNSVKYTPNGGTITHTVRQLPSDTPGCGKFEFVVSDTGMGMSKEFVEHIFEQFSRSDDSITKETQGTGLGMSIVGKLVELMGGTIDIRSEPGKGTTTTVTLDMQLATEDEIRRLRTEKEPTVQEDVLKDLRILLVDDNELNREILQEILQEEGCIVADVAENGVVALGKVESSQPGDYDLVLMDVQMPIMDGYEATRRIRALENKALAGIPIIALTANAFDEDKQNALAAGMNAHLTKPVDINRLKETLAGYI